jgi:hypothetical protein
MKTFEGEFIGGKIATKVLLNFEPGLESVTRLKILYLIETR